MCWSRVADYRFCAPNLPAGGAGRKARKFISIAQNIFKIFSWQTLVLGVETKRSLKWMNNVHP